MMSESKQKANVLLRWLPILAASVFLGAIGLWVSGLLGYPGLANPGVSMMEMLVVPLLIGLGIGLLLVGLNFLTPAQFRIPQLRFPESLLPYTFGGLFEEVLFRLFLLPVLVWLISFLLLKQRFQDETFWGVSILLAVVYLFMQFQGARSIFKLARISQIPPALLVAFIFASGLGALLAAYYFRWGGFAASFALRVGIYVVWHILWGAYAVPRGIVPDRKEVERAEAVSK
jgi:hypothetical protein